MLVAHRSETVAVAAAVVVVVQIHPLVVGQMHFPRHWSIVPQPAVEAAESIHEVARWFAPDVGENNLRPDCNCRHYVWPRQPHNLQYGCCYWPVFLIVVAVAAAAHIAPSIGSTNSCTAPRVVRMSPKDEAEVVVVLSTGGGGVVVVVVESFVENSNARKRMDCLEGNSAVIMPSNHHSHHPTRC